MAKEAPGEPHEVCLLDTAATQAGWRQVTHINAALAGRDAEMRRHAWRAADGQEIEGVLMLPDDGAERPLPLVVFVHGGPTSAWTYDFSPGAMHLGIVLAAEGYAVLLPNIRGSAGRGQEFARANLGDMGGGDLQDILSGIDSLVESGVVARDRVGITGVSYGGFMSAWAPTQTDAFAASVAIASVTNWLSFHNTSNIARFDELFLQSDPYDLARQPLRALAGHARTQLPHPDAAAARPARSLRPREPGPGDVPGARRRRLRERARRLRAGRSRLDAARLRARHLGADEGLVRPPSGC